MRWRRRYLEITYGCGSYRPYETLVREAAADVGLPKGLGSELERRWLELQPWPKAAAVLKAIPVPLAVATNCSIRLGKQAADRVGIPFRVVETAESVGFYKPRPEVYRAVLQKTRHACRKNVVRRRLGVRCAWSQRRRHAGLLAQPRRTSAARRGAARLSRTITRLTGPAVHRRLGSYSSLREARGGGAVIRDGGVIGHNIGAAHDPSAPCGAPPHAR